jgi:glycosyltransferase involved in cell wall biosynthesis
MKLSIITINKDNASGLEKTIQSVIEQTYKDFEYIVIDGNSTDGSVDIIKKYSLGINLWVSESDTGIYNAMNKGIRKAQGEYCLFLNSGDYLVSSTTLQDVFSEIGKILIPVDIFYSNCITSNGNVMNYPESLTINYLIHYAINHQNTLIKCSLFFEHGFYNENPHIIAEHEFFLKELWIFKSKFLHIKTNIAIFDLHGISSRNVCEYSINTMYQNVFHEMAETIIENYNYHKTIYYYIINNYGETKLLIFLLRVYNFIISKAKKIISIFKSSCI